MALYSIVEPRKSGFLKVDNLHQIYWELSGNSNGIDAIYIHGGPGGGTSPSDRRYFDPLKYNTLIFDQRGCGKSTPSASLVDNTTWDLVLDIEKLRIMLGIESFLVFGGSWGSTLALSYAITHPNRVRALVLRGIFTLRKSELDWFYQQGLGASCLFPDYWAPFLNEIPENERGDLIAAYYKRLTDPDEAVQLKAAREWATWECATSKLLINDKMIAKASSDKFCLEFSRIECHYFVNKGFFHYDGWILRNTDKIKEIPTVIVQGRYDVVCPMFTAWELHKLLPKSELKVIVSGHSATEEGIASELVNATNSFSSLLTGKV